ncbi:hypothetical protein CU097_005125 [Rhizopus azygosporus]|uniref:Secreted protein n=2 Tax=Rhizopus TaxID=4842 RepID=A0A367J6Q6_RHIAZ|nr:hypothetical protein BCV71DRAFT_214950 [Rhizopus microsporus]RCH85618.1 hypothetical protein CU097_005125 [Rhizopus azygosporus]
MVSALKFIASATLLASFVSAYGQIAQIVDANNFCVFLPPEDSVDRNIADTEWEGQAFCLGNAPKATNAGKLKDGFILSAHYVATDKYVQVTGQMDPTKARLNTSDEGGQFDIKAPKGSSCAGWKYYVNLIEPVSNTYCIRCCNDDRTCNRGISEKGCAHIIPGDYSGPKGGSNGGSKDGSDSGSSGSKSSSKATTKATTTKATTTKAATTTTTTKATTTTIATTTATTTTTTSTTIVIATPSPSSIATTTTTTTTTAAVVTPASVAPASSLSPASADSNSASSSTGNGNTSSLENDKATAQSVSGVEAFQPASLITLSATLVTLVLMFAQ